MNLYWFVFIENIATLAATVLVCWLTNSLWGLLCLLNLTVVKRRKKGDGE